MEATSRKQVDKGEGNLSLRRRHLSAGAWSSQETDQKGSRQETERKPKEKVSIAFVNKSRRNDHIQSGGGRVTACSLSLIRADLNTQVTEEEKIYASSMGAKSKETALPATSDTD